MISERNRVQVALMTGSDAELALRAINGSLDLELLDEAWERAKALGMPERCQVISRRMDVIRGT